MNDRPAAPPVTIAPTGPSAPYVARAADYLTLLLLALIWGSSFLFIEFGLRSLTPITLTASRITLGALVLVAAARIMGHKFPRDARHWRHFFLLGLFGHVLPFSLISTGQVHIDSGLAAVLIATVPLLTLPLAHAFTDDKINARKLIGVLLGFAGIVLLVGPDALGGLSGHFWGQLMIVGAALCFSIAMVVARRIRDVPSLVATGASAVCSTVMIVTLAFIFETPLALEPALVSILGILPLGILSTGLAMLLYFRLNATAGPNFVAGNNYIAPAIGVTWGVLLLGEPFTWRAVAAFAVILAGIVIATVRLPGRRPAPAPGE
ncbi:MAG TPA: EamA family transporter [Alphaproteobacteria bacterium]|nr:EamA family transporter [Alphaproteobacteria bacterium]